LNKQPSKENLDVNRLPVSRGTRKRPFRPKSRARRIFLHHATSIEQHGKDMRRFRMPQLCGLPQRLLGLSP
jgi:hypothetical protein